MGWIFAVTLCYPFRVLLQRADVARVLRACSVPLPRHTPQPVFCRLLWAVSAIRNFSILSLYTNLLDVPGGRQRFCIPGNSGLKTLPFLQRAGKGRATIEHYGRPACNFVCLCGTSVELPCNFSSSESLYLCGFRAFRGTWNLF